MAVGEQNDQPQGEGYGNNEAESAGSATVNNDTKPAETAVQSSSASGLSLGSLAGGVASVLTKFFNMGGLSLPLSNPLKTFASYNYIFTLYALNTQSMNSPGNTYYPGLPVICRSGSGSPTARINTALGKQEFYIDDLSIQSLWGFNGKTGNSIAQSFSFKVVEPYSMGGFLLALQGASYKMGYNTYLESPFCLMVQFMGIQQDGSMTNIPNTTKYYSMRFKKIDMQVADSGSVYSCVANPIAESALQTSSIKITKMISFSGKTVEEVLQSGKNSLTAVYNKVLAETATDGGYENAADQIAILFPTDLGAGSDISGALPGFGEEVAVLPTVNNFAAGAAKTVLGSLGLSSNPAGGLISSGGVNELGASSMGYSPTREGQTTSPGVESYNEKDKTFDQSKVSKDIAEGSFTISQDSTIINAINQVCLQSEYAAKALKGQPDEGGMRKMWIIIPAVYHLDTIEGYDNTGRKPRLLVFKVYPYKTHSGNMAIPGFGGGSMFKALFNQTAKRYEYLYTGKNVDIKSLDIKINAMYQVILPADANRRSQDVVTAADDSPQLDNFVDIVSTIGGVFTSAIKGLVNRVSFTGTSAGTDGQDGASTDTQPHRAARVFFDTMTQGSALAQLEMTIIGDPYWMSGSGTGNYVAGETQYSNVGTDMSVNPYNGEVDFYLNFRTPADLNQSTGLLDLKSAGAAQEYTGLYKVQKVTHNFKDGEFTQQIKAVRRPLSPTDTATISFNINNTIPSLLGKIF